MQMTYISLLPMVRQLFILILLHIENVVLWLGQHACAAAGHRAVARIEPHWQLLSARSLLQVRSKIRVEQGEISKEDMLVY